MSSNRLSIGRVPIDAVTEREAVVAIHALVRAGRGGFVVTPNIDHIVLAEHTPLLQEVYRQASLSLADGQPLVWMSRLLGQPLPAKVSGSDLIEPLMARAAAAGLRVFFFGTTPEISVRAERALVARHPSLQIVGRDCSMWSPADLGRPEESPVVRAVKASRADIVIMALGCPRQEAWMLRHAKALAPAIAIGLGASLDFVAGAVPRAPRWMSRAGMEWMFRLYQEPRRMAYRYLVRDPQIIGIFAAEWWRTRRTLRLAAHEASRLAHGDTSW